MGLPERAIIRPVTRLDHRRATAHRRVFEILINPEHDGKTEAERASLAGMAPRTWRKWRTSEVVAAALTARRAAYAEQLPEIDAALLRKAKAGSLPHILVAYERIEGWRPGLVLAEEERDEASREMWESLTEADKRIISDTLANARRRRHLLTAPAESSNAARQSVIET